MSDELFYPEINVNIGEYEFTQGIEIECYSSKDSYFDWSKIKFNQQLNEAVTLNKRDKAYIELGYDGVFDTVFEGYVVSQGIEIILKDQMIILEETYITETFLDATPQEILQFCLNKAGVKNIKLTNTIYPRKSVVPIFKKDCISVFEELKSLWKFKEKFFFSNGIFYWGEKPVQKDIYEFKYGSNIISLEYFGGLWILETVAAPYIKYSHEISIMHPKLSGIYEVEKVVFTSNENGFVRTYIYFKE
jgi:hypothetical protein